MVVIKTFNRNKRTEMEKFVSKFQKVFGYKPSIKAVQGVYICSIPDSKKEEYDKAHKEGKI